MRRHNIFAFLVSLIGSGVCNGDSGGAMTFEENGIYYIRGIASVSVSKGGQCDVMEYTVFTDVAKYLPWINDNF